MKREAEGGAAFPYLLLSKPYHMAEPGMSLRDWFAGRAMEALIVSGPASDQARPTQYEIAKAAYMLADAMLAQRRL